MPDWLSKTAYYSLATLPILTILSLTACSTDSGDRTKPSALYCDEKHSTWSALVEGKRISAQGVVHGAFQGDNELGGFFVQGFDHDQGLFVVSPKSDWKAEEGQWLNIRGELRPYYGGWKVAGDVAVNYCGDKPTRTRNLSLPLLAEESLNDYLFQRVELKQDMVVIGNYDLHRYGTLDIATERLYVPTQVELPGEHANNRSAYNSARRLVLDDRSWQEYPNQVVYPNGQLSMQNPVRSGDTVNNLEGILVKVGERFHLHPVTTPKFFSTNPRPEAPALASGDLRIASFNVLNYFNGDGQGGGFPTARGAATEEEFYRQRAKTISAMAHMDADIYALMEMENDGFSAHSALADLTQGLNEQVEGEPFEFLRADASGIGSDAITQAFIYRADVVMPMGDLTWTEEGPFSWGSRPPLLQNFRVLSSNKEVALIANHFKSKGGCPRRDDDPNANQGDGQACWNSHRVEAAAALTGWLRSNPKSLHHQNWILLGDFNAYQQEDPMRLLLDEGYKNVAFEFAPEGASYVFRGESGSLDHILVHESIYQAVVDMAYWHINADEPIAFEYPLKNRNEWQQEHFYTPKSYRSSDHDPVVIVVDSAKL